MPTFFLASDAIDPPIIRVSGPLLRHLKDSLRLQVRERLFFTGEEGVRYLVEVTEVTAKQIVARILETTKAPTRTVASLVLAQSLLKGEKMDWIIQKATELGVHRIVPIGSQHCIVKLHADRADRQQMRWERIAIEAAQQSERWDVPRIEMPTDLAGLFRRRPSATLKLILTERSTGASLNSISLPINPVHEVLLLVGPEGGWDQQELQMAGEEGYCAITLGKRILRAETAAIAAISVIQSRLGELG